MSAQPQAWPGREAQLYEHAETRALVAHVEEAAELVRAKGEAAFEHLRASGSFVVDLDGNVLVHRDPAIEGTNAIDLRDVDGKPVFAGQIAAATATRGRSSGFYHYRWPVPGGVLPRWKSSYVRLVEAPSGERYVVGGSIYDDRMERAFVVDAVTRAVALIEEHGEAALASLRDPKGPFMAKDATVFVLDLDGVELVDPAFPNLEGKSIRDLADARGRRVVREMLDVVATRGSGWVDFMWPKTGDCAATQKSAYVSGARLGGRLVAVGCAVYLEGAPREPGPAEKMTAPRLTTLVREAASLLEEQGERACMLFRWKGSKWLTGETYLFVLDRDGKVVFDAADPSRAGRDESGLVDVLGRPIGRMILDAARGPCGEGWVHAMMPGPGQVFPSWTSTFVKRVTFPSGEPHVVGCGVRDMQIDEAFVEDVVIRAAALVAERGKDAFAELRDPKGPFVFMDTYVFVLGTDGTQLVSGRLPGLEGKSLLELKDLSGKAMIRDEIDAAMRDGSAWLEHTWLRPGTNEPAPRATFVRRVDSRDGTFVVGAGLYR